MLLQTEHGASAVAELVDSNAFEDTQPIMERVCEHVDLSFVPGDELAVEPDLLQLLDHGLGIAAGGHTAQEGCRPSTWISSSRSVEKPKLVEGVPGVWIGCEGARVGVSRVGDLARVA